MYQRWTEGSFFIWILEISTLVRVGGCWGARPESSCVGALVGTGGATWHSFHAGKPSQAGQRATLGWVDSSQTRKHKCWGLGTSWLGTSWLGSAFQGNLVLSPVVTHHHQVQGSNMKFWPVNWSTRPDLSGTSVLVSSVYRLWNYAQNFAELL